MQQAAEGFAQGNPEGVKNAKNEARKNAENARTSEEKQRAEQEAQEIKRAEAAKEAAAREYQKLLQKRRGIDETTKEGQQLLLEIIRELEKMPHLTDEQRAVFFLNRVNKSQWTRFRVITYIVISFGASQVLALLNGVIYGPDAFHAAASWSSVRDLKTFIIWFFHQLPKLINNQVGFIGPRTKIGQGVDAVEKASWGFGLLYQAAGSIASIFSISGSALMFIAALVGIATASHAGYHRLIKPAKQWWSGKPKQRTFENYLAEH
jgi:hypothetical protein